MHFSLWHEVDPVDHRAGGSKYEVVRPDPPP